MKSTGEFLRFLREKNIFLRVDGEDLVFQAPKGAMTPEIGAMIKERKAELLTLFKQGSSSDASDLPPIEPAPRDRPLSLSFSQQRLWFLEQLDAHGSAYNISGALILNGSLDVHILQRCFQEIFNRHEPLRTVFSQENGFPIQVVGPKTPVAMPLIDLSGIPELDHFEKDKDAFVYKLVARESRTHFDISKGPLFRITLIRVTEHKHVLITCMHHIISDGWSVSLINRELIALYSAFLQDQPSPFPPLPVQYVDYAYWQREILGDTHLQKQQQFWKEALKGIPSLHSVPTDNPRPAQQTFEGSHFSFTINEEATAKIQKLCRNTGTSSFMCLYSAFALLLSRYSGSFDLSIGTPVANRQFEELEPLVGFFVNTIVLRSDLSGNPTFTQLLERLKHPILDAFNNQDIPFEHVVETLKPERNLSYSPLFQILFVLHNTPSSENVTIPGLELSPSSTFNTTTKFDLTCNMKEYPGLFRGVFDYNLALFSKKSVRRMTQHFINLCLGIAENPDRPIANIPLMDDEERTQILAGFNQTEQAYADTNLTLLYHLERQEKATPEHLALNGLNEQGERITLTYAQLHQSADDLAGRLQAMGIGPESVVGVYCERSIAMVVALVGIMKAGAAYLPLDLAHPAERTSFMLSDAGAAAVVYNGDYTPEVSLPQVPVQGEGLKPVPPALTGENAAYVIYTSGSTGKPKGVVNRHAGICNRLMWMQQAYQLDAEDKVLQKTPTTFDVSVWELFWPLMTGATMVLARPDGHRDPLYLSGLIAQQSITTLHFVPSMLQAFVATAPAEESVSLKRVICSGEALTGQLRDTFYQWSQGDVELHNLYGPTEAAVDVTLHPCSRKDTEQQIPIGTPIANTQAYVLDRYQQLVPGGAAGELCLAGANLARGYLGRPSLTAERFVPNPFATTPGGRLYRTGDLTRLRYKADTPQTVDYLGRIDFQVKLRGFRIELGEIEAALQAHTSVASGTVLLREDTPGDQRLVAYLIATPDTEQPEDRALRKHIGEYLPEYMVPSMYVWLDEMPLTHNGKLDRTVLPQPELQLNKSALTPPTSRVERVIAQVWKDLLKLPKVGISDNFFELGGHSLLLVQVFNRLSETYPGQLELTDLFRFPTIAGLAAHLNDEQQEEDHTDQPNEREGRYKPNLNGQVVIVGTSFRLPKANNLDELWQILHDGVETATYFSDEDLEAGEVPPGVRDNPDFVPVLNKIDDHTTFDAAFFGMTPSEAMATDPQQRAFLQEAWRALEHAGHDPHSYKGRIGLFGGTGFNNFALKAMQETPEIYLQRDSLMNIISNDKDYITTRTAYRLNLRGPVFTNQSACSTSLVAVHLARVSLLNGECEMALAGGVHFAGNRFGYFYKEGNVLSPDGRCHAFDERAQGTTFGDGVGLVLLKRMEDAIADGNTIYGLIKGSAINNDGSGKVGFMATGVEGQVAVIETALRSADASPNSIGYIETHGTGTTLGDPVEVAALDKVFRHPERAHRSLPIGSVKTNMGHLDAASGIAGLMKAMLALEHRMLPPSLNFENPNPKCDFSGPLYVNASLQPWEQAEGKRRAGVSSYGIGGTNAHVILEELPEPEATGEGRPYQLLVFSAKTSTARDEMTENLAEYLEKDNSSKLADVAFTLQQGRATFNQRRMLVCRTQEEAVAALRDPGRGGVLERSRQTSNLPITFMFSGQGSQYIHMAKATYAAEPLFRETVDQCADLLQPHLDLDLRQLLFPTPENEEEASKRLNHTDITQPALFVVSYALARLWMSWGIKPQSMIGHSIGEYVAATLAGVFALEDALSLVATRGRLMASMPTGNMLSVAMSEQEITPYLSNRCSLAAVNAPGRCVVSGDEETLTTLASRLAALEIEARPLVTSHAFHSLMMDPILAPFIKAFEGMKLKAPTRPFLSNVTGHWITPVQATDPNYWADHLRGTVRFEAGLQHLFKEPDRVFIEVGPGNTLATLTRRHPNKETDHLVLASLPHAKETNNDYAALLTTLGKCWLAGLSPDWKGFQAGEKRRRLPLPLYPLDKLDFAPQPVQRPVHKGSGFVKTGTPLDWFHIPTWQAQPLSQHERTITPQTVLCFVDEEGLSVALLERLEEQGHTCITVEPDEAWSRRDNGYTINPTKEEHYVQLMQDLASRGLEPKRLVHAWNITALNPDADVDQLMNLGYYSLILLAKALSRYEGEERLHLITLANYMCEVNGEPAQMPVKATLFGPYIVIPQELGKINFRLLDICWDTQNTWTQKRLINQLIDEITTDAPTAAIALRANRRLVQEYVPCPLPELAEETPDPTVREGGTYLITGGLGGIGYTLAKHFANTASCNLVLTSRSAVPPREDWDDFFTDREGNAKACERIEKVRELEALGAQVLTFAADVIDEEAMRIAVETAQERFGSIQGVIHAAGLSSGRMIQLKSPDEMRPVIEPKVQGTLVLDRLLTVEDLDYMMICSSVASVIGGFGLVDYTAANAFQDAYACSVAAARGAKVVAINWDGWQDVGMAVDAHVAKRGKDKPANIVGLKPSEGVEAFKRVLHCDMPQVVVVVRDIYRLMERLDDVAQQQDEAVEQQATTTGPLLPRPELDTPYVAPNDELEATMAQIWQECLGLERIGIHDNYFDIGGDSLLAVQIIARVKRLMGVKISMAGIFDEPTIAGQMMLVEELMLAAEIEITGDDEDRERGKL